MTAAQTRPTLLCCAFPFGYGPAVKLLLIARRLRAAGVHTTFLGHGIAHEMAASAPDAFDEVIHAHPTDPAVAPHIARAAGLFSMMDRDFAALALEHGQPLYVADSLHWMREQLPAPFTAAQRYWVQNFLPSSAASPSRTGAHPIPVGPIVEPRPPSPPAQRRGFVINLGGCETPAGPETENFAYAEFVLRGVLQSRLVEAYGAHALSGPGKDGRADDQVTLLAGQRASAHLQATFPDCGIAFHTATHDEALERLGTASYVLTSPGLTTTLECFQFAVPTYFLPPQNYSQWRILQHLQESGIASGSFTWSQIKPHFPALATVPEASRTALVRQTIREVSANPHAREMFAASLRQRLATQGSPLAHRQHEFFESLGPNGVDTIAGELIQAFR